MDKKMNNKELLSRREFFKKAAKSTLPILGAVVLAGAPAKVNATEQIPQGCYGSCSGTCRGGCEGCQGGCKGSCSQACSSNCFTACKGLGQNF